MGNQEFRKLWKQYEPFLQSIVELLHPFAEAAVHDLEAGKIVALYHNLSGRKVGDISPLKELKVKTEDFPLYFPAYYKENRDGRPLKCTSITLRSSEGKAVGLICVNVDVSAFKEGHRLLELFLGVKEEAKNPVEIFGGELELQAGILIQQYVEEKKVSLGYLTREQKKELVQQMFKKGIFNFKNAAVFLAARLNLSRASIYNYIKM